MIWAVFGIRCQNCYDPNHSNRQKVAAAMPLIKRYPNRKLYDTEAKSYVTLNDITRMIRNGQDVHVVDNESGEDLTNLTLTQIIFEQEKRSANGQLPRFLLTSIIRAGGERLTEMRRTLEAASETASDDFESVREQADAAMGQGQQMIDQMQALLRIDERVADVMHLLNLPSALDLQRLQKRLDSLASRLHDQESQAEEPDATSPQTSETD